MASNRKQGKDYNIREILEQMELDLIASMKRNLKRHKGEEVKHGFKFEQWQRAKLRELERFRRDNRKIIAKYEVETRKSIQLTLLDTYRNAQSNVSSFIAKIKVFVDKTIKKPVASSNIQFPGDLNPILKDVKPGTLMPEEETVKKVLKNIKIWEEAPRPTDDTFFKTNDKKFNALMETIEKDFDNANAAVLRRMDDVYRQVIFKAQVPYNTGTTTLDQAIDAATKDFLTKGIDAITYSDGKKVNIASYAEMALRTANHRAYLMGEGKKRREMGLSLVVVSAHATACKLCVPWQGLVLIDDVYSGGSPDDGDYPLLSVAMAEGFLHPNCRHNLNTYFPGVTTLPKIPDMEGVEENYKQEQRQRYIERQIRKYKRLAEGSINENNKQKYLDKVKEHQKAMREHLKENTQLRRAYSREQTRNIPYDFSKYDKLSGLVTKDNVTVGGISQHLKERVIERSISAKSIEDALKNPLDIGKIKYDKQSRPSTEYIGKNARVQINPETGNIITVWRTSSKLKNKYVGDNNGKD